MKGATQEWRDVVTVPRFAGGKCRVLVVTRWEHDGERWVRAGKTETPLKEAA